MFKLTQETMGKESMGNAYMQYSIQSSNKDLALPFSFKIGCVAKSDLVFLCLLYNKYSTMIMHEIDLHTSDDYPLPTIKTTKYYIPKDFQVLALDFTVNSIVIDAKHPKGHRKIFVYKQSLKRIFNFPYFSKGVEEFDNPYLLQDRLRFLVVPDGTGQDRMILLENSLVDGCLNQKVLYSVYVLGGHQFNINCDSNLCAKDRQFRYRKDITDTDNYEYKIFGSLIKFEDVKATGPEYDVFYLPGLILVLAPLYILVLWGFWLNTKDERDKHIKSQFYRTLLFRGVYIPQEIIEDSQNDTKNKTGLSLLAVENDDDDDDSPNAFSNIESPEKKADIDPGVMFIDQLERRIEDEDDADGEPAGDLSPDIVTRTRKLS